MRFLEHPGLSRLAALLKDLDVGDRVLSGRLELFSMNEQELIKEKPCSSHEESKNEETQNANEESLLKQTASTHGSVTKRAVDDDAIHPDTLQQSSSKDVKNEEAIQPNPNGGLLNSDSDSSGSSSSKNEFLNAPEPSSRKRSRSRAASDFSGHSSSKRRRTSSMSSWKLLGAHTPAEARKLLVQLVNTMNACFPDYDFSSVTPEAFEHIENFVTVYTTINYHLSFLVERIVPGFLQDLWASIKDSINLRNASIYSYINRGGKIESDPYVDDELCLFSFDYFFVDESSNKILFFSCMTKRKPPPTTFDAESTTWYDEDDNPSDSLSPSSSGELDGIDQNSDTNDNDENDGEDSENDRDNNDDDDDDGSLLYGEIRY